MRVRSFWSSLLLNDRRSFLLPRDLRSSSLPKLLFSIRSIFSQRCAGIEPIAEWFSSSRRTRFRRITGIRINYSTRRFNRDRSGTDSNRNIIAVDTFFFFLTYYCSIAVIFYPCNCRLFRCSTGSGSPICLFVSRIAYNLVSYKFDSLSNYKFQSFF